MSDQHQLISGPICARDIIETETLVSTQYKPSDSRNLLRNRRKRVKALIYNKILVYQLSLVGPEALVNAEMKGELSDLVLQRSRDVPAVVSDKVSDARLGQRIVQLGGVVVGGCQGSVLLRNQRLTSSSDSSFY